MGVDRAAQANNIAQASLDESKRQYEAQQKEKADKKRTAMANASGSRRSVNMAYSNNFFQPTDFTTGSDGSNFSLLTAGGTPSIIGQMNTALGNQDTLG